MYVVHQTISYILPAIAFFLLNKPHDCFKCFGKDPDRVFSISQLTKQEQTALRLKQKYGQEVNFEHLNKSDLEIEVSFNTSRSMRNTKTKVTTLRDLYETKQSRGTIVNDKSLLIESKDPLVFPTIDEHDFIEKMAGPLMTSHSSINSNARFTRKIESGSLPLLLQSPKHSKPGKQN